MPSMSTTVPPTTTVTVIPATITTCATAGLLSNGEHVTTEEALYI